MVITKVYRDNYTRELPTYIIAKRNAYQFGKKNGAIFQAGWHPPGDCHKNLFREHKILDIGYEVEYPSIVTDLSCLVSQATNISVTQVQISRRNKVTIYFINKMKPAARKP